MKHYDLHSSLRWNRNLLSLDEADDILEGHTVGLLSVVFSPSGDMIASGSGDNTVKLWDTRTGRLIHSLEGHTSAVGSVAISTYMASHHPGCRRERIERKTTRIDW